ncbi:hypothetical protein CkaCkLH20_05707 [Colletotrichum karsti]|uniref:Uncharacterized protein n=1 Tax=Colletotrichum karsti TaxID=1095194 RepID=A0A9P6IAA2_9PEZI|nr:uncharacterized protein CkaCkLH20_05707 [Colletotrichum karsti]KAF9876861.1 hypothetical protein CkaCkLH20_05707 [Colletotrichum karsti]
MRVHAIVPFIAYMAFLQTASAAPGRDEPTIIQGAAGQYVERCYWYDSTHKTCRPVLIPGSKKNPYKGAVPDTGSDKPKGPHVPKKAEKRWVGSRVTGTGRLDVDSVEDIASSTDVEFLDDMLWIVSVDSVDDIDIAKDEPQTPSQPENEDGEQTI